VGAQSFLDGFCSQTASQRRAFEPERWTNQQLDRAGSRDFPARIHPGIENCVTPRTAHEDAPLVSAEDKALKKGAQNFGEFEAKGVFPFECRVSISFPVPFPQTARPPVRSGRHERFLEFARCRGPANFHFLRKNRADRPCHSQIELRQPPWFRADSV
jgi:hypothetical protein